MTLEPRPQDDPYLLIRGYDLCGRASCQHERRWHAPCTARVGEQDQLGRCGCKLFLDVAAVQQQQVELQQQQTATAGGLSATQHELDLHEAQPDHKAPKPTPLAVAQDDAVTGPVTEPQVLAPDGSVVDPAPDTEVAQDTEAPAVMAAAAPAPTPAPKTRARTRRVKGR